MSFSNAVSGVFTGADRPTYSTYTQQEIQVIEEAKKIMLSKISREPDVTNARVAADYFRHQIGYDDREHLAAIFTDCQLRVCHFEILYSGARTSCNVDLNHLARKMLSVSASGLTLAHNHPSNLKLPSDADDHLTRAIHQICDVLQITFYDHLIVSRDDQFYSYRTSGRL